MGKEKLSDRYPDLVGKLYCGDCVLFCLEREDGVVTGLHNCSLKNLHISEFTTACKDISTINDYLKKNGGE